MTPEEKRLLEETAKLAKENNVILRKMRRSAIWGSIFKVIYWLVILGGLAVSWYYIEPYINTILEMYEQVQGQMESLKNFGR